MVRNTIVAIVISIGMMVTFFYLERAFRNGDFKRAIQVVQQTKSSPTGPTILEGLLAEYGKDAELHWLARTENNFRGLILVQCESPDKKSREWLVDLIHGTVSPHTPKEKASP